MNSTEAPRGLQIVFSPNFAAYRTRIRTQAIMWSRIRETRKEASNAEVGYARTSKMIFLYRYYFTQKAEDRLPSDLFLLETVLPCSAKRFSG